MIINTSKAYQVGLSVGAGFDLPSTKTIKLMRYILITLITICSTTGSAIAITPDATRYQSAYLHFYEEALSMDLFADPSKNESAKELRARILDYSKINNISVNGNELNQKWQDYLKSYKTPELFKAKLDKTYTNQEFLQKKFNQNQTLYKYFDNIVTKKITADIAKRESLLTKAKTYNIEISPERFQEKQLQVIASLGNDAKYNSFLTSYNLSEDDIDFFIRSELVLKTLAEKIGSGEVKDHPLIKQRYDTALKNLSTNIDLNQKGNISEDKLGKIVLERILGDI